MSKSIYWLNGATFGAMDRGAVTGL